MISRFSAETRALPTRLQILLWGVVMLLTLFLLLYDWSSYRVGTYGDDGSYVAVTDSLLHGGHYGMFLDPGEIESTQFPFVYPLLLAPLRAWFPENLNALRVVSLAATLALLTVMFWGWRWIGMGLSYWWGLAVTAVTGLSPVTILHGRTVMSEAVFLLFVLFLVVWVEYVVARSPRAWGILLGVLAVGTVYSRTVGWAFLVPAVGYLIWKMRARIWLQLGIAAATMAVFLSVIVAATTVQPADLLPQEYLAQLSGIISSKTQNSNDSGARDSTSLQGDSANPGSSFAALGPLFAKGILGHLDIADKLPFQMERAVIDATNRMGMPFLRYIPLLGALAVLALGAVLWLRRAGVTLFLLVTPFYVLMLLLWFWNGSRLIYPVQPQLILALLFGMYAIVAWGVARLMGDRRRLVVVSMTALIVFWLGFWVWLDLRLARTMLLPGDPIARAALLQQYIPANAIVISTRAETDYLYSPQRYIEVPRTRGNVDSIRQYILDHQVDYVVSAVGRNAPLEIKSLRIGKMVHFMVKIEPLIQAQALVELYRNPADDVGIYRVDKKKLAELTIQ